MAASKKVEAYYRLSQDDPDANTPLEVRIASRINTLKDLASKHHLILHMEDVHTEVESGGNIEKRPLFAALLERCERGLVSHLLTPYQHRLSRGNKADEQRVEDALISGGVRLVTLDGLTDFGDPNYDPLPFEVRALVARAQRRDYIKSVREAKQQNIKRGVTSGGAVSYGYRWIKPVYDEDGKVVSPGYYRVIVAEYAIVEELFRRIRTESLKALTVDLNRRLSATGQPVPPGRTRSNKVCKVWYPATVRDILLNPFYAGYPASRERILRNGKKIDLSREEWILPKEQQQYRHPEPPPGLEAQAWCPTTLSEQAEIAAALAARKRGGHGKVQKEFLASGLLYCGGDTPMSGSGKDYRCGCFYREVHPGMLVRTYKVHALLLCVLTDVIAALPSSLLASKPVKANRDTLRREYEAAVRAANDAHEDAEDLMQHRRRHIAAYGEALYERACEKNQKLLTQARGKVEELSALLDTPDVGEMLPLLQRVQAKGVAWYWERWTPEEKRQVLRTMIKRLDLVSPAQMGYHSRSVHVTLHEWVGRFYPVRFTREFPPASEGRAVS